MLCFIASRSARKDNIALMAPVGRRGVPRLEEEEEDGVDDEAGAAGCAGLAAGPPTVEGMVNYSREILRCEQCVEKPLVQGAHELGIRS